MGACGLLSLRARREERPLVSKHLPSSRKSLHSNGKKTNKLLSTSLWTCVYLHTSSVVAGGPLHSGGRSRRCIYMTGWTWPTSGNARRPGRRRSRGRCVCAVASSTVRPCTRRSSWAGRGGRSHIPHRTGEWALGLSGLGCTSSLSVEGKIWMSQPFLPNYL